MNRPYDAQLLLFFPQITSGSRLLLMHSVIDQYIDHLEWDGR